MSEELYLYHGSGEIVREPVFGAGRKHNDYGQGFYCTENEELAREWACTAARGGFSNRYILDMSLLRVLDLNTEEYSVLNWIAVLIENRIFSMVNPLAGRAKKYLKENFYVNVDAYDVIKGYRADDAYYDFAEAFLNNSITVEQLAVAMRLGKLGEQIVLKSLLAFKSIRFDGFDAVDRDKYYPMRKARMEEAEDDFNRMCEESTDGLYMADIIREEVTNDDARIPRNVFE